MKNKDYTQELFIIKEINYLKLVFFIILCIGAVSAESNINSEDTTNSDSLYDISYFDKSLGGNVLKNSKISKNIPDSTLSKNIVTMSKKGSVILKLGNNRGPKILIAAGIHGDESAANIATLRFLETIKNKKIHGTIYVIPFITPKNTAINRRNWYNPKLRYSVDPNRYSHVSRTPGNKIVQFAKKNNIKFIIDVHTGKGIATFRKGLVFANKNPTSPDERKWLKYIKKAINPKIKYNVPFKGSIRGYSRANNINAITFEVEKNKGSISYWANVEYKMLISACKYFKLF
ncbi:MAG: succinylglutamate desuccinylase/aspartoacylase family protein [Methanobrevibacter sp.]|nr:succinylglutamate desuccinylase/aspartoacylase family protein [Methanobrevibacter sp.]